eukprot:CAMPEP_0115827494 /NCGR_PEP_ID=MMETSP0287-20121206/74_1 /TAXON_ID=412157 /ORGANISM="Chrysochromulina rotalis, Strain UIO044" /LENGTH=140 /DNA_ID=CAMNT_0003280655 /DNA_START=115 /DNA_END=538 /DNA_ORIENTATION=-
MTYKAGCDTALDVRNLRKSDAPHKAKRKAMCLMKRLQAVVLAMVKAVKEKEARREAIAKERKEREALHAKYRLLIGDHQVTAAHPMQTPAISFTVHGVRAGQVVGRSRITRIRVVTLRSDGGTQRHVGRRCEDVAVHGKP